LDSSGLRTNWRNADAITRIALACGVLVGPLHVGVGLVQAFARDGFDPSRHSLSLLTTGSPGWIQVVNFVASGLLTLTATVGFRRATAPARTAALLISVSGVGLAGGRVCR